MDKRNRRRRILSRDRVGIVMSFYSPCGFETPKRLFADALARIVATGAIVAVTQATLPGQLPQPVLEGVRHAVYANTDVMFYKENLWNLAVEMLPDCDAFVFLDADVRLTDGWLDGVVDTLNAADVCQPFYRCRWLHRDGRIDRQMNCAAAAIAEGKGPWPHRYHPGFGIGITREAWAALGGIYERFPSGGGDLAFWLAMSQHPEAEIIIRSKSDGRELNVSSASYINYRTNAASLGLTIRAVPGITATHAWHGDRTNRLYTTREKYFPQLENGEPAVERRSDGLLAYTLSAPHAAEYFASRREDG
jgi:hypothetical protein